MRNVTIAAMAALFWVAGAMAQERPFADLRVEMTANPEVANAGDDVAYSIRVANGGPDPGIEVRLDNPLPIDMVFVSLTQTAGPEFACTTPAIGAHGTIACGMPSLASGASADLVLVARLPAAAPPGAFYASSANVRIAELGALATFDPNDENDTAVASTMIAAPTADLGVSMSAPESIGADQTLTYVLTLRNAGPADAIDVVLTDTLPAPLTFVSLLQQSGPAMGCTTLGGPNTTIECSIDPLPAGSEAVFELVAHVPPGTPAGTELHNQATFTSATIDNNPENDSGVANTTVSDIDLQVTRSGPAASRAGDEESYSLRVRNAGSATAFNVRINDNLPAYSRFVSFTQIDGPTFDCTLPTVDATGTVACIGNLESATDVDFVLTVRSDVATPHGSVLGYLVSAAAIGYDIDPSDNAASADTVIDNDLDLSIEMSAPSNVDAGQPATYTITLANAGPDAARDMALIDELPAGTTFESLQQTGAALDCSVPAVGSSGTVTCTHGGYPADADTTLQLAVRVSDTALDMSSITNSASVATSTPDRDGNNDVAMAGSAVLNRADLGVTLTAPESVGNGTVVTLRIGVTNTGPLASDVELRHDLIPGTGFVSLQQTAGPAFDCTTPAVGATGTVACNGDAVANGASAAWDIVVSIDCDVPDETLLEHTATVTTPRFDPVQDDDSASATQTVIAAADLQISKSNGRNTIVAGGQTVYALRVSNAGPSRVCGARLVDVLPDGLDAGLWQCVQASSTATCPMQDTGSGDLDLDIDLAPGEHLHVDLSADVTAPTGRIVDNTAQAILPAGMRNINASDDAATDSDRVIDPVRVFVDGFEGDDVDVVSDATATPKRAATMLH